ncbi:hypothetical protein BHM03_00052126 [Ensete ventricosum]|nr:hypothetical protein BHM03_00052126 [Ensete ventricosum]
MHATSYADDELRRCINHSDAKSHNGLLVPLPPPGRLHLHRFPLRFLLCPHPLCPQCGGLALPHLYIRPLPPLFFVFIRRYDLRHFRFLDKMDIFLKLHVYMLLY